MKDLKTLEATKKSTQKSNSSKDLFKSSNKKSIHEQPKINS